MQDGWQSGHHPCGTAWASFELELEIQSLGKRSLCPLLSELTRTGTDWSRTRAPVRARARAEHEQKDEHRGNERSVQIGQMHSFILTSDDNQGPRSARHSTRQANGDEEEFFSACFLRHSFLLSVGLLFGFVSDDSGCD
jgi:hypothetical protein